MKTFLEKRYKNKICGSGFCKASPSSFDFDRRSKLEDQNKKLNLIEQMVPGIYEIICIPKKKVYVGQSENLLARFGKHYASLTQNQHDCKALQNDWNQFKDQPLQNFEMRVICSGSEWESLQKRCEKEKFVIEQKIKDSFSLYNIDKAATFTRNYRRKIEVDGKEYETIAAVAKDIQINVSETVIRRRLDNPTYKEITRLPTGYKPVGFFY